MGTTPFLRPQGTPLKIRDFSCFVMADRTYDAGQRLERHSHEEAFFIIPIEGGYLESCAGKEEMCRSGMVLYRPIDVPHANVFQHSARSLQVQLKPEIFERLRTYGPAHLEVRTLISSNALAIAHRIRREFTGPHDQATELALECLLIELLVETDRLRRTPGTRGSKACFQAAELLRAQISDPPQLSRVAAIVGIDPVQLAREFRTVFDCSLGEYLRQCRVEHAENLLKGTACLLTEIAQLCGFYDQSHFTRTFRKVLGMGPLEYRKRYVGDKANARSGPDDAV